MAKNSSGTNRKVNMGSDYDQVQANIRKAKGNPNKNVHQKKNGSNYKGYVASKEEASAKTRSANTAPKKPLWVTITMIVIFVVLVAILILMNGVMKDNLIFGQIATIVIGLCCGTLFYMRRFTKSPDSKFQDVLYVVLAVMSVIMVFMGAYGLWQVLKA